jgi:hypothetical protein
VDRIKYSIGGSNNAKKVIANVKEDRLKEAARRNQKVSNSGGTAQKTTPKKAAMPKTKTERKAQQRATGSTRGDL